jgi:hypothetical protein
MITRICVVCPILSQLNTWKTQAFNPSGQANNRHTPFPMQQVQQVIKEHVTNLYTSVQLSPDLCNSGLCELRANTNSHDFLSSFSVNTTKIIQLYV